MKMNKWDRQIEEWLQSNMAEEQNPRRRELLNKGLGHGTIEFLRTIWLPIVGNLYHLYPEWEVLDFGNGYRYIDLAYRPGNAKGAIEIQGYGPHARDLDVRRFKDLCRRHCLLALDGWTFLPIAYPSITDEPKQCQQLVLSFIGKFTSTEVEAPLSWLEAETVRYARRLLRPFPPSDLVDHLKVSDRTVRRILHRLVDLQCLDIASGNKRIRSYVLRV